MRIPGDPSPLALRLVYNKKLRVYLYSEELPPLLELGGAKAEGAMKIMCIKFECYEEDGARKAIVPPAWMEPVLVWLAAVPAAGPNEQLFEKLVYHTPRSAFLYVLELREPARAYADNVPMIPATRLQRASKVLVEMLDILL